MPFIAAIGAAIAGAFGASIAATGVLAYIIGSVVLVAANVAISFVEKALAPKFKSPVGANFAQDAQSRTVTVRQPVAPWRVIYGSVGQVGGIITFIGVNGSSNEFFHLVITLAGHQLNAISTMYFDGVAVPLNGSGDCVSGRFNGLVHAEFNLGSPTQTAFAGLVAAMPAQWTSNHRQRGRAGAYVRLKWDVNAFPNGVPNITFDIIGHNQIFDPRTSGTGYFQNAALCLREYLTNTSYGLGCSAAELDDVSTIASANNCDEAVALAAGGTESRYTTNGMFETSQAVSDTINQLLSAMAGDVVYIGGKWSIFSGMWRPPSVTLTDSDLRDALKVQSRLSKRDTANGIKGLYLSPANKWQPSDYPAFISAAYVTEDSGEVILKELDLPFTTSAATAQRIAKIQLEMTRRQVSVQYPAKLSGYQVQPCDVVQITHPRTGFAWNAKTFKVTQAQLLVEEDAQHVPALVCDLTLRETDLHVYDWSTVLEKPALASSTVLPDQFNTGYIINVTTSPSLPYNGDFEQFSDMQPIADGWDGAFDETTPATPISKTRSITPFTGIYAQSLGPSAPTVGGCIASRPFDVRPNLRYTLQVRAISDVNNGGRLIARVLWYADDDDITRNSASLISVQDIANTTVPNAWTLYSGEVRSPSHAKFARVALYNSVSDGSHPIATLSFDRIGIIPSSQLSQMAEIFGSWAKTVGAVFTNNLAGGGSGSVAWIADGVTGSNALRVITTNGGNNPFCVNMPGLQYRIQNASETWRAYVKITDKTPTQLVLNFRTLANGTNGVGVFWGASDPFGLTGVAHFANKGAMPATLGKWIELAFTPSDMGLSAGDVINGVLLGIWQTSGTTTAVFSDILGEDDGDRRLLTLGSGSSSGSNNQGSLVTTPNNPVTYTAPVPGTSSTAVLNFSWAAFTGYRLDRGTFPVASGSASFTGLTSNSDYYFSDYVDSAGVMHLIMSTQSAGKAPEVFPTLLQVAFDGRIPVKINFVAHTATVAGSPGGGGGGGDVCPAEDQPLPTLEHGIVEARELPRLLREGAVHLKDGVEKGVWNLVQGAEIEEGDVVWVKAGDESFHVEIGHRWLRAGGDADGASQDWIPTHALTLNTLVEGGGGQTIPIRSLGEPHRGKFVHIMCERSRFAIGKGGLGHNIIFPPNQT